MRLQQVVQPDRPGSFFEGLCTSPRSPSMNCRSMLPLVSMTHSITSFPNTFLVHVHADIFSNRHKGCSFLERLSQALQTYSKRGALL